MSKTEVEVLWRAHWLLKMREKQPDMCIFGTEADGPAEEETEDERHQE
jgi:hypothetical protein